MEEKGLENKFYLCFWTKQMHAKQREKLPTFAVSPKEEKPSLRC